MSEVVVSGGRFCVLSGDSSQNTIITLNLSCVVVGEWVVGVVGVRRLRVWVPIIISDPTPPSQPRQTPPEDHLTPKHPEGASTRYFDIVDCAVSDYKTRTATNTHMQSQQQLTCINQRR